MREQHITKMLDDKAFSDLSADELASVDSHSAICSECRSAYQAARIAASLVQARASETVEAGAFFKTRVMSAIRERRLSTEEPVWLRMWRAAGALMSTIAVLFVILVGMTIVGPDSRISPASGAVSQNLYSAEYVVFERGDVDDDLAADQVVSTIYDLEDGDGQ